MAELAEQTCNIVNTQIKVNPTHLSDHTNNPVPWYGFFATLSPWQQFEWKLTAAALIRIIFQAPIRWNASLTFCASLCNSSTSQVLLKKRWAWFCGFEGGGGDRSKNTAGKTLIIYYASVGGRRGGGNTLDLRQMCKENRYSLTFSHCRRWSILWVFPKKVFSRSDNATCNHASYEVELPQMTATPIRSLNGNMMVEQKCILGRFLLRRSGISYYQRSSPYFASNTPSLVHPTQLSVLL